MFRDRHNRLETLQFDEVFVHVAGFLWSEICMVTWFVHDADTVNIQLGPKSNTKGSRVNPNMHGFMFALNLSPRQSLAVQVVNNCDLPILISLVLSRCLTGCMIWQKHSW
jgi:hypothetical protein